MKDPKILAAVALILLSTVAVVVGPKIGLDDAAIAAINGSINMIALVLGVQAPNAQTRALLAASQEKTE